MVLSFLMQSLFRLELLLANVRTPEERAGDIRAQIAANYRGVGRVAELITRYGTDQLTAAMNGLIEYSERTTRQLIDSIPDGVYRFSDVMDDDGLGAVDIPIRLRMTIEGDRLHADFTGTSLQVQGNINVTMNATQAAVAYSLKGMLDPDIPNNQGVLDVCETTAPVGCLLNCVAPAPVAAPEPPPVSETEPDVGDTTPSPATEPEEATWP